VNQPPVEPVYDVLVVEDDFMVAQLHTSYLETVPGFRVVATANTAADALAALTSHHPDLMLLDIHLPDMNGIELLHRSRQKFPDIDVIMVTAAREVETVRNAVHGGAVSYLIKPFEYRALGERLAHFRQTRSTLDRVNDANQRQIDELFGLDVKNSNQPLPKGLSRETAKEILKLLSHETTISSTECAQQIGLSRVSARRYLEHLESVGVAEIVLKYGAGRPERRFRLR